MRKWLRRFFIFLLIIILLGALGILGIVSYVKPEKGLNLSNQSLDLGPKLQEMALSGEPELVLTEADINNILKQRLSQHRQLNPDIVLNGARFELDGDLLTGHVGVTYKGRLPAGAVVVYHLQWREPNLVAVPEQLRIRSVNLPIDRLEVIELPLFGNLPKVLSVKSVTFDPREIRILFQANLPSLPFKLPLNG
jgi:hypothetical protein